jgi:hypothetical protein
MSIILDGTAGITTPLVVSNVYCVTENAQTISTNYTIPTSTNAMSAGPITIGTGYVVTVSTGSRWVVV